MDNNNNFGFENNQGNSFGMGGVSPDEVSQTKKSSGMSIASMVLGICGIVLSCCIWYVGMPCAIVGLVLGIVAVKGNYGGRNMAIAGIVLSSVAIALFVILLIFSFAFYDELLRYIESNVSIQSL